MKGVPGVLAAVEGGLLRVGCSTSFVPSHLLRVSPGENRLVSLRAQGGLSLNRMRRRRKDLVTGQPVALVQPHILIRTATSSQGSRSRVAKSY